MGIPSSAVFREEPGRISDIVPGSQFVRILGPVPDEHANIVHPGRGVEHIVVIGTTFAQRPRQLVKPRLILKTAIETANQAKHTNAERLGKELGLTRWVNDHFLPTPSPFAYFGYFAV